MYDLPQPPPPRTHVHTPTTTHHPPPVAKDSNTKNMMTKDGMTEVFAAVDAIAALSVKSGGKTYTCVA